MYIPSIKTYQGDPTQLQIDYDSPYSKIFKNKEGFAWMQGVSYVAGELTKKQKPILSGSPKNTNIYPLGRAMQLSGAQDFLQFGGYRAEESTGGFTALAILCGNAGATNTGSTRVLGTCSTTNKGFHMGVTLGATAGNPRTVLFTKGGVVDVVSPNTFIPVKGTPMVIAVSFKSISNTVQFACRNLLTGSMNYGTNSNASVTLAGDNIYHVGGSPIFSASSFPGYITLVVHGRGWLPQNTLLEWIENPYGIFTTPKKRFFFGTTIQYASPTGPKNGSTFVDDNSNAGNVAWTNPGNAQLNDAVYATSTLLLGQKTDYLKATGFGFQIPSTHQIDGILVEIERKSGLVNDIVDDTVKLVKAGSVVGNNLASGSQWPQAEAYASYGGASNLWGTTWTPTQVNASNFGMVLAATASSADTASVDHIRITIYHSIPVAAGGSGFMSARGGYWGDL